MAVATMFRLRFREDQIQHWAARYEYPGEQELIEGPVAASRARGHLTRADFLAVARWKSPRSRSRCARNDPHFVEEVTRLALEPSTSDRLRIESLTLLTGVAWPTASVILHFCHREVYPILDFRALWSLRCAVPTQYGLANRIQWTGDEFLCTEVQGEK
jgi:hypothetical protein